MPLRGLSRRSCGFESRHSRKNTCKMAYCVVRLDAKIGPTTQTGVRVGTKRPKTDRNPSGSREDKPFLVASRPDREAGVRLHEMAGGQGSPSDAVESVRTAIVWAAEARHRPLARRRNAEARRPSVTGLRR
jgi:hypothetical protein